MTTSTKRINLKPSWMVILGVIFVFMSYLLDNSGSLIKTILQVIGIMLVIFGIILWSAKLNSKRNIQ